MKKLTRKRRLYLLTVTRRRTARRLRRLHRPLRKRRVYDPRTPLRAPRVFTLEADEGCQEVIDFLAALRRLALDQPADAPEVRIDFSQTVLMTAAATLLFAAELRRINVIAGKRRVACTYPRDGVVAQVLQHVGIFQLLGQRRECLITSKTVRFWKIDSGTVAEGAQVVAAMHRYRHLFSDPNQRLYRALTEAITNCRQHAYEAEGGDGYGNVLPNWWMFSQHLDGRLTIAIGDLGMGIPRSLPKDKSGLWSMIAALMKEGNITEEDGSLIQAAMAVGETRTAQEHRGKGLMDMRSVLDGLNGKMQIHSNRGYYHYDAETKQESCKNFGPTASIRGTIVLWQIPV